MEAMIHDLMCPLDGLSPEERMPGAVTCLWCDVIDRTRASERERVAERIREDAVLFEAERKVDGGWIFRIIGPSLMTIYEHCADLAEKP